MDKNNGKSHFFVRMVQDSQRQSNRPLVCPRCSEDTTSFPTEGRLFEHATTLHSAAVGGSRDGLAWKNYYAEAVNKTYETLAALVSWTGLRMRYYLPPSPLLGGLFLV